MFGHSISNQAQVTRGGTMPSGTFIFSQCLESRQANGQVTRFRQGLRVASGFRGGYPLPLGLELYLPCHSRGTGDCTNAHA